MRINPSGTEGFFIVFNWPEKAGWFANAYG